MLPLVCKYLENHSLDELWIDHGIKNNVVGEKISLNYDYIRAEKSNEMAKECRGLILRHQKKHLDDSTLIGPTDVLARPFDRFFNYGEEHAAHIDTRDSEFYSFEKLDGTLIIVYENNGTWEIATRSVPDASRLIEGSNKYTFRLLFVEIFEKSLGREFEQVMQNQEVNNTYLFELVSPINRVVVHYDEPQIWYLGSRNRATGIEYFPWDNAVFSQLAPRIYSFSTIDEAIEHVLSQNPRSHEGVVFCDSRFRRVKIKHPQHLNLSRIIHRIKESDRALLEVMIDKKSDDIYPFLPEYLKPRALEFIQEYNRIINTYDRVSLKYFETNNKTSPDNPEKQKKSYVEHVKKTGLWLKPFMMYYKESVLPSRWLKLQKYRNGKISEAYVRRMFSMMNI